MFAEVTLQISLSSFLVSCKNSLYILDTSPLMGKYFCRKLCPVCGLPFHLCECLLRSKNFLFDEIQFDVFLLRFVASVSYLRNLCQILDHCNYLLRLPLEVLQFQPLHFEL